MAFPRDGCYPLSSFAHLAAGCLAALNGLDKMELSKSPALHEQNRVVNDPRTPGLIEGIRVADGAVLALLALLAFLSYGLELVLGWKPMDMDILNEHIPTVAWLAQVIRSGGSPLWVPGVSGGFPLAFGQYSIFDPVTWVAAIVLDPNRANALVRMLYLAGAGVATYSYGRVLGLSLTPSLLAAMGYQLSTEAVGMPAYGNGVQSLFLLPALLLSIELAGRRGIRWAGLGAIAVGLSMVAGGAYVTAIALLSAALYTLARVLLLWRDGLRKEATLLALSTGASVALGMGLAAFRILPTMVITAESVRSSGMSLAAAAAGSPGTLGLLAGYLLPLSRLPDLGNQGEFNAPGYVGPVILVLAIVALPAVRRNFWVALFVALALFNLLASLGDSGPVFGVLHALPGMGSFRGAQRFSTASALFLSLLAAWALDKGISSGGIDMRTWFKTAAIVTTVGGCLVLAAGVLWLYGGSSGAPIREFAEVHRLGAANPLRPRMALALVALPATLWLLYAHRAGRVGPSTLKYLCVALTAGLLLMVNQSVTLRQPEPSDTPATVRFLQQDGSLFRVMSHTSSVTLNLYLVYLAGGDPNKVDGEGPREYDFRVRYMAETLTSNHALEYGLQTVNGQVLLQSIRQAIALSYLGSDADLSYFDQVDPRLASKLWDIRSHNLIEHLPVLRAFNVKYVLSNFELWQHSDVLRLAYTSPIRMLDPGSLTNVYVYEVIGAMPRAYLVPESATVGSAEEAMDALWDGRVDPSQTVMLERPAPPLGQPRLNPARSSAQVASYGNTEVSMDVRTDGSGFLVLSDSFYPGWQAWVDGAPVPILVANGWVRALPIQGAGSHAIRFAYQPPLFNEGRLASLASLALLVAMVLVPWSRIRSMTHMTQRKLAPPEG